LCCSTPFPAQSFETKERVIYNKEVQTTAIETDSPDPYEEEIRQRLIKERDLDAERLARDKALEEEEVKLEKQIEQEIRGVY
jgi:dynein intermediate chain, cytosolic